MLEASTSCCICSLPNLSSTTPKWSCIADVVEVKLFSRDATVSAASVWPVVRASSRLSWLSASLVSCCSCHWIEVRSSSKSLVCCSSWRLAYSAWPAFNSFIRVVRLPICCSSSCCLVALLVSMVAYPGWDLGHCWHQCYGMLVLSEPWEHLTDWLVAIIKESSRIWYTEKMQTLTSRLLYQTVQWLRCRARGSPGYSSLNTIKVCINI